MCALSVVVVDPTIQINLQLLQGQIKLFVERHLVEILHDGLVKTFADAIRLGMLGLGSGVLDMIQSQV